MMLSKWVKDNKGIVARIGAAGGSGFFFADKVDAFTLYHITTCTGIQMHTRQITETYPSVYGGMIVLIEGKECGTRTYEGDKREAFDDIPIEYYQRIADSMCASYAEDYKNALIKSMFARSKREENAAESTMYICEQFFLSDQFAILMPKASGRQILKLIDDNVYKEFGDEDD